jgi:hypothetical protein
MNSTESESVIIMEFHATEECSNLDLTKAKYNKNQLSAVEKMNEIVRDNPSSFVARETDN